MYNFPPQKWFVSQAKFLRGKKNTNDKDTLKIFLENLHIN